MMTLVIDTVFGNVLNLPGLIFQYNSKTELLIDP